jgi:hypothetical protein
MGPYRITRVHSNGTITIELSPGVVERTNIRRAECVQWVPSIKVSPRAIGEDRGLVLRCKVPLEEGFSFINGSHALLSAHTRLCLITRGVLSY